MLQGRKTGIRTLVHCSGSSALFQYTQFSEKMRLSLVFLYVLFLCSWYLTDLNPIMCMSYFRSERGSSIMEVIGEVRSM